jgi:hypothetical protein
MSKSRRKTWIIETPDGIITTSNLNQFCEKYDIKYHSILTAFYKDFKTKLACKILERID